MDQLPQEILRFIIEDVEYKDLEPLRLVNKNFAAAAAVRIFGVHTPCSEFDHEP